MWLTSIETQLVEAYSLKIIMLQRINVIDTNTYSIRNMTLDWLTDLSIKLYFSLVKASLLYKGHGPVLKKILATDPIQITITHKHSHINNYYIYNIETNLTRGPWYSISANHGLFNSRKGKWYLTVFP